MKVEVVGNALRRGGFNANEPCCAVELRYRTVIRSTARHVPAARQCNSPESCGRERWHPRLCKLVPACRTEREHNKLTVKPEGFAGTRMCNLYNISTNRESTTWLPRALDRAAAGMSRRGMCTPARSLQLYALAPMGSARLSWRLGECRHHQPTLRTTTPA